MFGLKLFLPAIKTVALRHGLRGAADGSIVVDGSGDGHGIRRGGGDGYAVRSGTGNGD